MVKIHPVIAMMLPDMKPREELKMWIAIRTDLNMSLGKLAAQVGHAFLNIGVACAYDKAVLDKILEYTAGAQPKISVEAKNEQDLHRINAEAKTIGIWTYMVVDAGRTELAAGSATICVFGPAKRSELSPYLRRLRLLEEKI